MILAHEISRHLPYEDSQVSTVLGVKKVRILNNPPVLISILRAAQPLIEGFLQVFNHSECGFIGAFRVESEGTSPSVTMGYHALPDLKDKTVIVADPMLATGKSMVQTVELLKTKGVKKVYLAVVVAAPEGLKYVEENLALPYSLWTGSLDDSLNSASYIVPGLGDAGDLAFGKKIDIC